MNSDGGLIRRADASGVPLLIARLLLGGIMITYAVPKIAEPVPFLKQIHNYEILPEKPPVFLNLVAMTMPWIEMVGSAALILGIARRGAGTLLTGMLVVFTAAILFRTIGIYRAEDIAFCAIKFDCGCGHGPVIICKKLASNLGLILLAAYSMLSRSDKLTLPSLLRCPRAFAATV